MVYTTIDNFYLTNEQLQNTPSRKDGIDESTETTIRIYSCDLIQESGILLKVPQQVMTTGQVLFHRFYHKKSFAHFNVKRLAASCVWLALRLEENRRNAKHIFNVFHRMECRRENLPMKHVYVFSEEFEKDLIRSELHLLKELGFVCHVELPHKFISSYLATLETPPELRQEAWNLAIDSLRTTLCVRFKSAVVACIVVYAAARRFHVPLPENPPWWKALDADKASIDEVCRLLAHLYSLPKAQYIPVCKKGYSFTMFNRSWDSPSQPVSKEGPSTALPMVDDKNTTKVFPATVNLDWKIKVAIGQQLKDASGDHLRDRDQEQERHKGRDCDCEKGRDSELERERERHKVCDCDREKGRDPEPKREREKVKDRSHWSKDRG